IKTCWNLPDLLAQGLAVAQERRASERVHLRPSVVDIIFARHLVADECQEIGERIAEHGAPPVADVPGARRIGRDVLNIDFFTAAYSGGCGGPLLWQGVRYDPRQERGGEGGFEKAAPRHVELCQVGIVF